MSVGNKTYELHLKTKNYNEEVSVRQIIRQIPAKASVVRQPKKVYCEMIGMGAKSSTINKLIIYSLKPQQALYLLVTEERC
jgi:hypothetical protein